jgi:signal transduction histidine kinase
MNNLVGNAIKFTPNNGSIIIEANFDDENKEIRVIVQDTGSSIAQSDLKKVFDKFYQAPKANSEIVGTGIGLSVAKEIVELHGGKIWAESEQDHGAKFIFTLPLNAVCA